MVEQLNSLIDSLRLDHKRGAAEIVQDAAELFVAIGVLAADEPLAAEHLFQRAVKRLARGQPTMAPVLNLLNRVCVIQSQAEEDWVLYSALLPTVVRQPADYAELMKLHITDLPASETLITFSNSSTVATLVAAAKAKLGWPKRVYCGEGRPVMEGLVMARKLTAAGLDVTIFTDAALMSRVAEADGVWVGGDSLSREGLVNKVGSRALAMLARFRGIPFISMMGSDKLLPTGLAPYFRFLLQNPREIGAGEANGLNVHNEYYEQLPLDLITHILTEGGVASPLYVVENIENEPVSPLFAELVRG